MKEISMLELMDHFKKLEEASQNDNEGDLQSALNWISATAEDLNINSPTLAKIFESYGLELDTTDAIDEKAVQLLSKESVDNYWKNYYGDCPKGTEVIINHLNYEEESPIAHILIRSYHDWIFGEILSWMQKIKRESSDGIRTPRTFILHVVPDTVNSASLQQYLHSDYQAEMYKPSRLIIDPSRKFGLTDLYNNFIVYELQDNNEVVEVARL